jgi:hypothetical protein
MESMPELIETPADEAALSSFLETVDARVQAYLRLRNDREEQMDHLRHVADRTRWIYFCELQRLDPGASLSIPRHDNNLIEACVLSHDIGKWIPRDDLRTLMPASMQAVQPILDELRLSPDQSELMLLGIKRRLALPQDGYTPAYDAAHHLVSAFILASDPTYQFRTLDPRDQERLINMIIGHQFGSYFKERIFQLSLNDAELTTGMLIDISRPEQLSGDTLGSSFHDADISDLLFVGSLERRPNREDILHAGGLVKILLINFTNLLFAAPGAPASVEECIQSCQFTVNSACKEFLTPTAVEHGNKWRRRANLFLAFLQSRDVVERFNAILMDENRPPPERLKSLRLMTYLRARDFLSSVEGKD